MIHEINFGLVDHGDIQISGIWLVNLLSPIIWKIGASFYFQLAPVYNKSQTDPSCALNNIPISALYDSN